MSMSQSEIFLHFNLNDGWVDLACRADEFAFEISSGRLAVISEGDGEITGLDITALGRPFLKPMLPTASA
jgi:hypothetical protein